MGRYVSSPGRSSAWTLVVAVIAVLAGTALPLHAEVLTGVSRVEAFSEPGYEGYWRYCIEFSWTTNEIGGKGMSFVNFFIDLGDCPCACDPGIVVFPEDVGTGVGENGCELDFVGIYDCGGDPHFPERGPSIKFESACNGCEPGPRGAATVCFYSMFEPGDDGGHRDVLGIKSSLATVTGDLVGVLPICVCGSPVEPSSWGVVKGLYR